MISSSLDGAETSVDWFVCEATLSDTPGKPLRQLEVVQQDLVVQAPKGTPALEVHRAMRLLIHDALKRGQPHFLLGAHRVQLADIVLIVSAEREALMDSWEWLSNLREDGQFDVYRLPTVRDKPTWQQYQRKRLARFLEYNKTPEAAKQLEDYIALQLEEAKVPLQDRGVCSELSGA